MGAYQMLQPQHFTVNRHQTPTKQCAYIHCEQIRANTSYESENFESWLLNWKLENLGDRSRILHIRNSQLVYCYSNLHCVLMQPPGDAWKRLIDVQWDKITQLKSLQSVPISMKSRLQHGQFAQLRMEIIHIDNFSNASSSTAFQVATNVI